MYAIVLLMFAQVDSDYITREPHSTPVDNTLLREIDAHYKPTPKFPHSHFRNENDLVNWGHEMTHAVNQRMPDYLEVYVTKNRYFRISNDSSPDIRTITNSIPAIYKTTGNYKTYMKPHTITDHTGRVQVDTQSLFIWDEMVAYINGSLIRKELQIPKRDASLYGAGEFLVFAHYYVVNMKSNHPQKDQLIRFLKDEYALAEQSIRSDDDAKMFYGIFKQDQKTQAFFGVK